ncbi:hypothetical protein I5677_00730 [Mobilitalea sibirica]|uniref:dTDP-4-amino-4,6-dideoxygalactose transaminase n=1 Tax=Mobilitalea sibirica TaxID=1462919 RepID=A0A8J7HAZ3_9FIRM|nr:hypothetical protein [Mobilitalea sibirica]MBH1939412.1 hypothetical protein [Mobilitalea sibirica]
MKHNKEFGSFLELEFMKGREYYTGSHIARLNTGRAGIYHACRVLGCEKVCLPYYECHTVREFLEKKGMKVRYYYLNEEFCPILPFCQEDEAVVLVNYFGVMGEKRMKHLAKQYPKVIIDNAQAFFAPPLKGCMNVYSVRKFIGAADGAYVIGNQAERYMDEYQQDYSSDTGLFLLLRIEYGCEGKAYENRVENEERLNTSDIRRMSELTHAILDGTDYERIRCRRRDNFSAACDCFDKINQIEPKRYYSEDCVPMVYPLLIEKEGLPERLVENKLFQGHWWSHLLMEVEPQTLEFRLSQYLIPVTIDQRYGKEEMESMFEIIMKEITLL